MMLLLATVVKVSVLLLLVITAGTLLRRSSAAVRHWVYALGLACALLMPVFGLVAPRWQVPAVGVGEPAASAEVVSVNTFATAHEAAVGSARPNASAVTPPLRMGALLLVTWSAGTAVVLGVLLGGLWRLAATARSARPEDDETRRTLLREVARAHGVRRSIRVLYGDHPALVATWGVITPTIILPPEARSWPLERLRVLLCHEVAHIRRGDWSAQLLAELLRGVYWFNPLVWIACRRLRQESEHACDDAVLNVGVAAPVYATHLLDLARLCSDRRGGWSPALPVARPSGLERRVRAMLDPSLDRHPLARWTRVATIGALLAIALPVAGVGVLAQGPFATVAGTITDSLRGALTGATLSVVNTATAARNEVRSDGTGRFELVGLPPGDYVLETSVPGFKEYRAPLALNGQQVDRDIVMEVATLEEVITVSDAPPRVRSQEERDALERRNELQSEVLRRASAACREAAASNGGAQPPSSGGRIRPPMKIVDVRPEYPATLKETKVGGSVDLEARIGTDGSVREIKNRDAASHPALVDAATKAVQGWRFDETLLNCVPIEVWMTVHVTFTPRSN
jgi:TonB family protein